MKIKILLLSLILVFPLIPQSKFKLIVRTDKQTYVMGEPIQVGISLINTDKNSVYAESLGKTELKLIDINGNEVKRGGVSHVHWGPFKNHLEPDEEDYNVFLLNNHFGNNYFPGLIVAMYYEPGVYTVVAEFYPTNSLNKIKENISFEVTDVAGAELVVFNRFAEILKFEVQNKLTKDSELQTANAFRTLYETYPNSVYSPYILVQLKALYHIVIGDRENSIWAAKELVEKHSSSISAFYQANWLIDQMKSGSEKIEYIKKIKTKSEGTLMEKMYDKRIAELEK